MGKLWKTSTRGLNDLDTPHVTARNYGPPQFWVEVRATAANKTAQHREWRRCSESFATVEEQRAELERRRATATADWEFR